MPPPHPINPPKHMLTPLGPEILAGFECQAQLPCLPHHQETSEGKFPAPHRAAFQPHHAPFGPLGWSLPPPQPQVCQAHISQRRLLRLLSLPSSNQISQRTLFPPGCPEAWCTPPPPCAEYQESIYVYRYTEKWRLYNFPPQLYLIYSFIPLIPVCGSRGQAEETGISVPEELHPTALSLLPPLGIQ